VTIIGGLGGPRTDHALTNIGLLEHPSLAGHAAVLYDERAARISLLAGPGTAELPGRVDDLVTLLPVGAAAVGVRTHGLRFPLAGETLEAGSSRGLSNVRVAAVASVSLRDGRLLVIETPATVGR
jgi:thiamine pyrophosphokinase